MTKTEPGFLAIMGVLAVVIFAVAVAVTGLVWWGLWNLVVVPIFGATKITYWLACGLSLLLWAISGIFRGNSSK